MDDLNKTVSELNNVQKVSDLPENQADATHFGYRDTLQCEQMDRIIDTIRKESEKTSRQNRIIIFLSIVAIGVAVLFGILK